MYCNQSSWLDLRLAVGGLSVAMSTTQFIQQNETRIQNMDGNLDEANITILGDSGCLEFYYFIDGVLVGSKVKIPTW
jgi:hypothetical protein